MHVHSERRQQEAKVTDWGPQDGDNECWVPGTFWSQLHFLPLDVGRYTGTCHVCPINPPLLPVA